MDDGGWGAEFLEDEEDSQEFRRLNERARMLAERALYHNDLEATLELQTQFSPLVRRIKMSVKPWHRDELVGALTELTMKALRQAIEKRVDLPLAYVLVSLRREGVRLRGKYVLADLKRAELTDDLAQPAGAELPPSLSDAALTLERIDAYRDAASASRSKIDILLADVVATCYLNECGVEEAYALLALTRAERVAVTQRMSKERKRRKSRLNRLGDEIRRIIGDLADDEVLHQPNRNEPTNDDGTAGKDDEVA